MARVDKRKRTLIIVASAAGVLVVAILAVLIMVATQSKEADPYKSSDTSSTTDESTSVDENATTDTTTDTTQDETDTTDTTSTLDPSTVSEIDIEPMGITVSYVKGVGGFEYQVLRATSGTQYVEFRSPDLIGTKCTDDEGTFASIYADPKSDEEGILTDTTEVDGVTYGLALSASTCTSDADLLMLYQDSFSQAFSLLKVM